MAKNTAPFNRVLLTGASGSLGGTLAGRGVALALRMEDGIEKMTDELRREAAGETSVLIHLAAMTSVDACEKNPDLAREINVAGTRRLFLAAQQTGIARFVYVSTAHVYAPPDQGRPVSITHPTAPKSVYARTKLEGEQALRNLEPQGPTRLSVARVFSLRGAGLKPGFLYRELVARAERGDFSPLMGAANVRDFMDIADVGRELLRLAFSDEFPPLVNICSGRGTSVRALAEGVFRDHGLDPALLPSAEGRPSDVPVMIGQPTEFR